MSVNKEQRSMLLDKRISVTSFILVLFLVVEYIMLEKRSGEQK